MAVAVESRLRPSTESQLRNSTLFKRVSATAMGMEADALCRKSHWVPKSTRSNCSNCKRLFRLFNAKHNCRLCGEVVCGQCSTKRILFQKKSVRSCDECVNHSVRSISEFNRRSSTGDIVGYDVSSDDGSRRNTMQKSKVRALVKRNSDSEIVKAANAESTAESNERMRRKSSPATHGSSVMKEYRRVPRVESWRLQIPYAIVMFLVTVAGITNFLAYA